MRDRLRVRCDEVGEAARRDRLRSDAELAPDATDDPVDLAREAVDEPDCRPATVVFPMTDGGVE